MYRNAKRLFAAILLAFLIITFSGVIFSSILDGDNMADVWISILEYIPFGKVFGTLCLKIFSESIGLGKDMSKYVLGLKTLGNIDYFSDVCKLMLTGVLVDAFSFFLESATGTLKKSGIANTVIRSICNIVSAFLCTGIAAIVLRFLDLQLVSFSDFTKWITSFGTTILVLIGSVGVFYFILGGSIVGALVMSLVKLLATNMIKVAASYITILLVILFLSEGAYAKIIPVLGSWAFIIFLMFSVERMLASIFE